MIAVANRIGALARRDLTIELTYPFQLVLRFVGILVGIVMFFFLGRLVGDAEQLAEYRGGYFDFVLIGLIVMNFSQVAVRALSRSIQAAQDDGTFEILLATPTRLWVLMLGTFAVPLLFATVDAAFYLVVGWILVGFTIPLGSAALAAVLLVLTAGTFVALGLFSASVIVLTKRGDPFASLGLLATQMLAGVLFPVTVLPDWLQVAARFVPAFYGLRGTREVVLAGGSLGDVSLDLLVLVACNVVLLPLALWTLSRAVRIARITGTLGNR